jgi:hypothetical protein
MSEHYRASCICSTQGFENVLWTADYYPEECPSDWRLAYFMNDFRALYLPWQAWCGNADQIKAIADEIADEIARDFELVIEWPPQDEIAGIESALVRLAPLEQHICAVVVLPNNFEHGMRDPLLDVYCQAIGALYTVHLDVDFADSVADFSGLEGRTGFVWHPDQSIEPCPRDGYLIVRLPCQDLRSIKATLIELKPLIDKNIRIGLFIEPAVQSVQRAMEVRTLIELMGLA